ncbi:RHH-type rel operon transcriptional repressor/antitoxin RelB [Arcanobacterium wilhelmae]|uniref:RHH-type rel operon transcriptional repressor/antitoxin RelB n=1 Tax=Arcanobacterium wilhelmae TaxID=1803177 RepID=A0ABT9NBW3_9ACTO|nr:RHH-type rel operon transcriptional repressor/antitoxin RelB [Arcanobacterium wilhelmae]
MATETLGRPVSVRLPESLQKRVEAIAESSRRSRGDVLREAMERIVDQLEWEQHIAAKAMAARAGERSAVSLAELDDENPSPGISLGSGDTALATTGLSAISMRTNC